MRIAFSTNGRDLDSLIDPAFGRCRYFIVVEPVTSSFDIVENPGFGMTSGAGIKAAEMLANLNVDRVVTGSVGPNARPILNSADVEIANGSGTIRDALENIVSGTIKDAVENIVSGTIKDAVENIGSVKGSNENDMGGEPVIPGKRRPEGFCYCPKCKYTTENDHGGPCFNLKCPQCGIIMERKYS